MAKGICKECKKDYKNNSHARTSYCSRACMFASKEFKEKQSLAKKGKEAWNKGKPNTWYNLEGCRTEEAVRKMAESKKGKPSPNKGKTIDALRGENNPNWKGGIRGSNYLERRRFRSVMQKDIFDRDDYTCQLCGSKKDLQVDHIQSWSEYVELRFDMNNCRTLCAECHYEITFRKPMPKEIKGWGHNLMKGRIQK